MTSTFVVPLPEPRPAMPGGGGPEDDRRYLQWREAILSEAADRFLARHWHDAFDLKPPLEAWRLDGRIYRDLNGACPLFGEQDLINYNHRLRFLAVALRTRRREVIAAASRFLEEAIAR